MRLRMEKRRPGGGRAEKGQKTGKQEPYRGDSHPGTPQGLYRADNPHGTPDGGGPAFLSLAASCK